VDTTHEYRTIDQTMEILQIGKKGRVIGYLWKISYIWNQQTKYPIKW
jgi:hypothetical protein